LKRKKQKQYIRTRPKSPALLRYSFFINSYPVNALKIARPGPAICDVKGKKDVMNRSCRGVMCESKPKLAALKIDLMR